MADPHQDRGDQGGRDDPRDGQGPDRALRRGADPAVARRRLHRRVRGAHPGRRGVPHRQVGVHRAVRVRVPQPRRGAAPDRRGRGDDPHEGRGRHRQRGRGRAPRAHDARARSAELHTAAARAVRDEGQGPRRAGRARPDGRRAGPAAGRELLGGRHRDARRRGADDAARRRRRLRRLGHLQVRGPGHDGPARSSRRRRTSRTPTCSRRSSRGSATPMQGLEIGTLETRCRTAAGRPAGTATSSPRTPATIADEGRRARPAGRLPRARASVRGARCHPGRGSHAGTARRGRLPRDPRRRVDDDRQARPCLRPDRAGARACRRAACRSSARARA